METVPQENAAYLASILDLAGEAIIAMDVAHTVVLFNQAAESIFGYRAEEIVGRPVDLLIPPRFIEAHRRGVERFAREEIEAQHMAQRSRIRGLRKDGSEFSAEASISKVRQNGRTTFITVMRDISGRQRMEAELQKAFQLLEERVEERTRGLQTLLEVSRNVSSILDVDELLTQTVRLIQDTFGYYHVHIGLIEEDVVVLPAAAGVYEDEPNCSYCASLRLGLGQETVCGQVAATGIPLLVPDISQEPRYLHPMGATGSGVVVPLKVKDRVIGLLDVENRKTNAFDENNVAVLQLLASQIAVAIENAQLYEQAQSLAALQERQKLARELHDSVSQALYGIALGTKTALALLDSSKLDETQAAALSQPLEYTMSLAKAGQAEMRALIFELRPESLQMEGLVAALTRQVDALSARHQIAVQTTFGTEPDVPVAAKEVLYRVAQEALHNVVRHAGGSHVEVSLQQYGGNVILEIRDDGRGFDVLGHFPGHLGLQSMRERIEGSGGVLVVTSAPGQGTCVRACVPLIPIS